MTDTRVFTMNMQHAVDRHRARAGLVLTAHTAHAGGCQEWGPDRAELLLLRGWDHHGLRRPNLWRRDRFKELDGYLDVLEEGRKVKRLPGRRAELGDVLSRVTVLEDLETGQDTTLINVHLPAAIEVRGRPRRGVPDRVHMAEAAIAHLVDDYRAHDAHGIAYVLGDLNIDTRLDLRVHHSTFPAHAFAQAQAVPCWLGNMPPRRDGTLGKRLTDVIYTDQLAAEVVQIRTASDHDGLRATYRRAS